MKITDIEQFRIPIDSGREGTGWREGTTVEELIKALQKLPKGGVIAPDYAHSGHLIVMHAKPDIDPDCDGPVTFKELMDAIQRDAREAAQRYNASGAYYRNTL